VDNHDCTIQVLDERADALCFEHLRNIKVGIPGLKLVAVTFTYKVVVKYCVCTYLTNEEVCFVVIFASGSLTPNYN
jgi:hypothetical protein